jgi:hypothetical protein
VDLIGVQYIKQPTNPNPYPLSPIPAKVLDTELLEKREAELLEKEGSGCRVLLVNDMVGDLGTMRIIPPLWC